MKTNYKNMNKKIYSVIGVVIIAGLSFYGGIKYNQSTAPAPTTRGAGFAGGQGGQRGARGGNGMGGFVSGTILSKDATGITVQLRGGGSQIVFMASSTEISKSAKGTADDLTAGELVTVMGVPNSDGTLNAQTIQIRPAQPQTGGTQ